MNQVFVLAIAILATVAGFALMIGGPPAMRTVLLSISHAILHYATIFVRWAWQGYWRFIVGFAAGVFVTLYFMGRFP